MKIFSPSRACADNAFALGAEDDPDDPHADNIAAAHRLAGPHIHDLLLMIRSLFPVCKEERKYECEQFATKYNEMQLSIGMTNNIELLGITDGRSQAWDDITLKNHAETIFLYVFGPDFLTDR